MHKTALPLAGSAGPSGSRSSVRTLLMTMGEIQQKAENSHNLEILQQPLTKVSCNYPLVEPGKSIRVRVTPMPPRSVSLRGACFDPVLCDRRLVSSQSADFSDRQSSIVGMQTEVVCQLFICGFRADSKALSYTMASSTMQGFLHGNENLSTDAQGRLQAMSCSSRRGCTAARVMCVIQQCMYR